MAIVIINGSPRTNGLTAAILRQYQIRLHEKGNVETQYYNLSELTMDYCKGCSMCYRTGECIIKDDAEALSQKISACDGLIIGTPTYASNVSGLTKTFIDRGHFVIEQLLHQKHAASVVTYENYGGKEALSILNKLLTYSGAYLSAAHLVKGSFVSKGILSAKLIAQTNRNSNTLYFSITRHHRSFLHTVKHRIIFNWGIKPFVLKKGEKYAGVLKRWQELNLIT